MAAGMAGGDVLLRGASRNTLDNVILTMERAGVTVETTNDGLRVKRNGSGIMPVDVTTDPYPRLPHGFAGAIHGHDDHGQGHVAYP